MAAGAGSKRGSVAGAAAVGARLPGTPARPGELPPGAVSAAGTGADAAKTKKKPIPVDPALLEKALMNRYQPH